VTAAPAEFGPPSVRSTPTYSLEAVPTARSVARVIGLGYAATAAILIALGFALTKVVNGSALDRWDRRTITDFASHRTTQQTRLSAFWSKSADAPTIVLVALVIMTVLAIGRNWRQIGWIAVVLATELAIFLTVSYTVGRVRPDVVHLGSVPSTGSFPSGHIAVTVALYGTVVSLVRLHTSTRLARTCALVWMMVAAAFVGWARMYRGMHHPLDVIAGAALGLAVWWLGVHAFTPHKSQEKELTP
jgi:membrane-associated phospholipid phosphatase